LDDGVGIGGGALASHYNVPDLNIASRDDVQFFVYINASETLAQPVAAMTWTTCCGGSMTAITADPDRVVNCTNGNPNVGQVTYQDQDGTVKTRNCSFAYSPHRVKNTWFHDKMSGTNDWEKSGEWIFFPFPPQNQSKSELANRMNIASGSLRYMACGYFNHTITPWADLIVEEDYPGMTGLKRHSNGKRYLQDENIRYVYNLGIMSIYDDESRDLQVTIHCDEDSLIYSCNSTCSETLPINWTCAEFKMTISDGITPVFVDDIVYVYYKQCPQVNCYYCFDYIEQLSCGNPTSKAFLYSAITMAGLLVLIVIIAVIYFIFVGCRVSCCVPIPAMAVLCLLSVAEAQEHEKEVEDKRLETNIILIMILVMLSVLAAVTAVKTKISYNKRQVMALGLLCLVGSASASCDANIVIGAEYMECTETTQTVSCLIKTESLLTLTGIYSTLCATILSANEDMVMGYVNITLTGMVAIAPTTLEYYTSSWRPTVASTKYCPGERLCSGSTNCANFNFSSPSMNGAVHGLATLLPGINRCDDSCGGWSCGCINFGESCTYSRASILPLPPVAQVRKVLPGLLKPIVTISTEINGVVSEKTVILQAGVMVDTTINMTMTYIGSGTSNLYTSSDSILLVDGAQYKVAASPVNNPQAGMIGDVQANNAQSFTQPSYQSFKLANNLCDVYLSDSSAHAVCFAPALGDLTGLQQFPLVSGGVIWEFSGDNTLVGAVQDPDVTFVSMGMLSGTKIVVKKTQVCPVLNFVGVTGYWGEDQPATIVLEGRSACLAGHCVLNTIGSSVVLRQKSLYLDVVAGPLTIPFSSSQAQVSFDLQCTSLKNTVTVHVEGTLTDPTPVTPTPPSVPAEGYYSWFDKLSLGGIIGLFVGLFSGSFLMIGGIIAAMCFAPAVLSCCAPIFSFCCSRCTWSKNEKYEMTSLDEDIETQKWLSDGEEESVNQNLEKMFPRVKPIF